MNLETKQCQNCKNQFRIEPEDFEFYNKIGVPAPTFCPDCRMKRRMVWRNERTLYKRKNDVLENNEEIISIYHKDAPVKVYDQKYWWSDNWDSMEYGKEYDFSESFFYQLRELYKKVPQNNLMAENCINSDYVNFQTSSKGCYLVSGGYSNENVLYANHGDLSKDSRDLYFFTSMELSYEDVICQNSYKLFFSQNCDSCSDSVFLYDCKNCLNCFGCIGLRSKQYCIFNKEYSKEEYEKKIKEFNLGSFIELIKQKELFEQFKSNYPRKFINSSKSIDISGDNILDAKNCKLAFDVLPGGSENSKFVFWSGAVMKDVYDGTGIGVKGELLYEGVSVALSNAKVLFSVTVRNCHDIQYSINCHSSSELFGCVGLKKKQYCILNKQYTKEEYMDLVPRIIEHMNEMPYISQIANSQGQIVKEIIYKYGEFFPSELSPFSYNETIAQEYFPLTKEQAIEQGYSWKEPETRNIQPTITSEQLPDNIKDVDDTILKQVIECEHKGTCNENCTTAFKIIPQELEFYRKMNLPLPRLCPNCRHYQRIKQRNPLKLWHRKCMCNGNPPAGGANGKEQNVYTNTITHTHGTEPCTNEFETTYSPDRPEIVYCEACYQQEVV